MQLQCMSHIVMSMHVCVCASVCDWFTVRLLSHLHLALCAMFLLLSLCRHICCPQLLSFRQQLLYQSTEDLNVCKQLLSGGVLTLLCQYLIPSWHAVFAQCLVLINLCLLYLRAINNFCFFFLKNVLLKFCCCCCYFNWTQFFLFVLFFIYILYII